MVTVRCCGAAGALFARVVGLGQMAGGEVEIVSGIAPGDMIAVTGATQLAEGMQVSRFGDAP